MDTKLNDEQKKELQKAIAIADKVMQKAPSRKLADAINGMQELVEGK